MQLKNLIGLLLLLAIKASNPVITIDSDNDLITWLCKENHDMDLILDLNSAHDFTIDIFCVCNTTHSLLIRSASESSAHIMCKQQTGFAFNGASNLTLQRLSFINCGAKLTYNKINSSLFTFARHHSAALFSWR